MAGCATLITGRKAVRHVVAEAKRKRTSVRNAELAIEAVALRLARVSRPAPVTETQSLSAVRGTRWSGRRNQTARFAFFGKSDERVEVRRQGVGSNAGPHFRF